MEGQVRKYKELWTLNRELVKGEVKATTVDAEGIAEQVREY